MTSALAVLPSLRPRLLLLLLSLLLQLSVLDLTDAFVGPSRVGVIVARSSSIQESTFTTTSPLSSSSSSSLIRLQATKTATTTEQQQPQQQYEYALLFDCDGVILETEELHRQAYNAAFREFDLTLDDGTPVEWSVREKKKKEKR